jgi:hypothetical protein
MFYLRKYGVESAATGEEATGTAAGAGLRDPLGVQCIAYHERDR